ncbi:MAG TPA: helix-turn-helix transcriptional regulator [Ktedonobacteraceae bacterium]|jgi:transcriptional regulator with XRE-family HTH domain|nr:helix-turn-helix transcriptional regulator [Ktedonobacteraceae bacterium]
MQQHSEKQRRKELGEFLRTRRTNLSSQQIGMPPGLRRRTPGLRREEVAIAAGMSTTWYTSLEQGRDIQVSSSILSSLANVLQLTEDEQTYLFTLAKQPLPLKISQEKSVPRIYQHVLDEMGMLPALLTGRTYDILGWNRAARMVFGDFGKLPENERNLLWLLFARTPSHSQITLFVEQEPYAQEILETFRSRVNRDLDEPEIAALIERLQQASPIFQKLWSEHNVRSTCSGRKRLSHPLVGNLSFETATFQVMEHPAIRCHLFSGDEETTRKLQQLLAER